jgi:hypothetical protein
MVTVLDRVRSKVTYANVMSSIAVFGLLGSGGAYAAAKLGPGDIKPSAVRSTHIKNGSVRTPDLAGGAVTAAKLADGVGALQGPPGPKGDPGPRGPSHVYGRYADEIPDLPNGSDNYGTFNFGHAPILSLPLPAGSFDIQATGFANGQAGNVGCVLVAGSDFDASLATLPGDATVEPLVMQVLHEFSQPGQVELRCTDYGAGIRGLFYVKVHATQVESFSNSGSP